MVLDLQPFKHFEMEAIFVPTVKHNSKILFETSLWDT